jgi:ORF6N domain
VARKTLLRVSPRATRVKRNIDRFPSDFMFQLKKGEATALRSQSAISKEGRGGRRLLVLLGDELVVKAADRADVRV